MYKPEDTDEFAWKMLDTTFALYRTDIKLQPPTRFLHPRERLFKKTKF